MLHRFMLRLLLINEINAVLRIVRLAVLMNQGKVYVS